MPTNVVYGRANQIICQKRRKKKNFVNFLSKKKEKSGLEQYPVKVLLLILIVEYIVTIGISTVNQLSQIVAMKDLLNTLSLLMVF